MALTMTMPVIVRIKITTAIAITITVVVAMVDDDDGEQEDDNDDVSNDRNDVVSVRKRPCAIIGIQSRCLSPCSPPLQDLLVVGGWRPVVGGQIWPQMSVGASAAGRARSGAASRLLFCWHHQSYIPHISHSHHRQYYLSVSILVRNARSAVHRSACAMHCSLSYASPSLPWPYTSGQSPFARRCGSWAGL